MREMVSFALPLILMSAASAVNAFVDRLFLSWHSDVAVQAVVPAVSLAGTFSCLAVGTVGCVSALAAQAHGRGDSRGTRAAFAQGIFLSCLFLPLFAAAWPVGCALIGIAGHSADVAAAERAAFAVLLPSGGVSVFAAALGGYFAALGRTRVVGIAGVVGSVVNLALDPLLVFGAGPVPSLGIVGSALATLAASFAAVGWMALAVAADFRRQPLAGVCRLDAAKFIALLRLGLPYGAMSLFCGLVFTAFVMATGRCDALSLAVSNVAFGINGIYYMVASALREGTTSFVARSIGAGDYAAARCAVRSSLLLAVLCSTAFSILVLLGSGFFALLFHDSGSSFDPTRYRETLAAVLAVMCVRTFAEGASETFAGALRGAGETASILRVRVLCGGLCWMPLVFLASWCGASIGALWMTMPVYLALSAFFLRRRWLRIIG